MNKNKKRLGSRYYSIKLYALSMKVATANSDSPHYKNPVVFRMCSALRRSGYEDFRDVAKLLPSQIRQIPGLGKAGILVLNQILEKKELVDKYVSEEDAKIILDLENRSQLDLGI